MADIFEQLEAIPSPTVLPTKIVDFEKLEKERRQKIEDWKSSLAIYDENIYQEWVTQKPIDTPVLTRELIDWGKSLGKAGIGYNLKQLEIMREVGLQPTVSKEEQNAVEDFVKFYHKKSRERLSRLTPEQRSLEIEVGGVGDEDFALEAFAAGALNNLSFGAIDTEHAIYGNYYKEAHPKLYTSGQMAGEIMAFIGLSQIAAATKIPAKLLQLSSKSKPIKSILNVLGRPKVWADKLPVFFKTARNVGQKYVTGRLEAGALGATTGMVGATMETTKNLIAKYKNEHKLSDKDWRKKYNAGAIVPVSIVKGFFEKYGISLINDPRSWSWRLLGDSLWSAGKMGSEVMLGQREDWDMKDYWKDMLMGHVMGEVQGRIFSPSLKMMQQAKATQVMSLDMDFAIRQGIGKSTREPMVWRFAQDMLDSSLEYLTRTGRFPTDEVRIAARNKLANRIKQDLHIKQSFTHPNSIKISDPTIPVRQDSDTAYDTLMHQFSLRESTINELKLKDVIERNKLKTFLSTLNKAGRITDKVEPPDVAKAKILGKIKPFEFGYFSKKLHERLTKAIPSLFKGVDDKVSRTLDLLRPKDDTSKTETKKELRVEATPEQYEATRSKVTNYAEQNIDKITKGFSKLETKQYTVKKALNDVMIKMIESDYDFFIHKGKNWTNTNKGMGSFLRDAVRRNLLYNRSQRVQEIKLKPLENVINERDMQNLNRQEKFTQKNKLYNILLATIRDNKKATIMRTVSRYLKSLGMSNSEITARFKEFGVDIRLATMREWLYKVNKDIDILLKGGFIRDNIPPRRTYTKREAAKIFEDTRESYANRNIVTGIEKDLTEDGNAVKLIKQNGGGVYSLTDFYRRIILAYNKNIADGVLSNSGKVMQDLVNEININYANKENVSLFLKNPINDANTKFVVYQKGLNEEEFISNLSYISKVLKENYVEADYTKRFSITLQDKEVLDNIPHEVTFTKSVKDLTGEVMDLKEDLPSWKLSQINEKDNYLLTTAGDPQNTRLFDEAQRERRENTGSEYAIGKHIESNPTTLDEITSEFYKSGKMTAAWMRRFSEKLTGIKKFANSIERFANEQFTIWEELEVQEPYMPIISAIYRLGTVKSEDSRWAIDQISSVFQDSTFSKLQPKQRKALGSIIGSAIENEFGRVVNKDSGNPEISAAKLREPIRFTTDLKIEDIKGKLISGKELRTIQGQTGDKLVLTKLIHQLYDIDPEVIINTYKSYFPMSKLLDSEYRQGLYPTMADQSIEPFERIRTKLKERIINKIKVNENIDPRIRQNIDNIDFEDVNTRAYLESLFKDNDEMLRTIKSFYEIDPEVMAYVPHIVMEDPVNQRQFEGEILDFIKGRVTRGEKALSPVMKEAKNRKFATKFQLIDAGYKVSNKDFFEELWAQLTYLKTKNSNMAFFQGLKDKFTKGALNAKRSGLLGEFFEEHGGFFYKPSDSEFKLWNGLAKEVDKKIAILQDATQNTKVINDLAKYNRMKVDIQTKLSEMKELVEIWQDPNAIDYADKLFAGEAFIPLNRLAFDKDITMPDFLSNSIKKQFKRVGIDSYKVPFSDGLYFNRIIYKGMKQFVFRDNFLDTTYEYDFLNKIKRVYDSVNIKGKLARLVKPSIMVANDMMQLGIANPFAVRNIPFAVKAVNDYRNNDKTSEAEFVIRMDRKNLYNRAVSTTPIFSDGYRAFCEGMNKNPFLGKIIDNVAGEKNWLLKFWRGGVTTFKTQQEFTWYMDEILRTTLAKSMNDRFVQSYGKDKGDLATAEWTNMHMVNYSRIPSGTRRMMNRIFMFPTYRIGTMRLYKELIKNMGRGIGRAFGKETDPLFRVDKHQSFFEVKPFINMLALKGTIKGLMGLMFGFGYDSIFDAITGYRLKRKKGEGIFDSEFQFLSLSTPLFEMEKYISRPWKVSLRYNMAFVPGFVWSYLISNQNPITGKRIVTTENKRKAAAQIGMDLLKTYFPLGTDMSNMFDEDKDFVKKMINFSGMGFFYKHQSPHELYQILERALDKGTTMREHQRALKEFGSAIRRTHRVLFNEEFKDALEMIEESKNQFYDTKL